MKLRKITKILKYGKPSCHHNRDLTVLLECGHSETKSFPMREMPVGRRIKCCECSGGDWKHLGK